MRKTIFGWMIVFAALRFLDRSVRQSNKEIGRAHV